MTAGRIATLLVSGTLDALSLLLRAIGAAAGASSDTRSEHGSGQVRTGAGTEPAATNEHGQLVGAHSGLPATEIVVDR